MINRSIYDAGSGGKRYVKGKDQQLTNSLSQEIFIALFGGNVEQSTDSQDNGSELELSWWGNDKTGPSEDYVNSETERVLKGSDLSFQSLREIKAAVKRDTEKFKAYGTVEVEVGSPRLNYLSITVRVIEPDKKNEFSVVWDSMKSEVIDQITIQ